MITKKQLDVAKLASRKLEGIEDLENFINQVKDEEDFIWLRTGDRIGDQVISSNDPMHTQLVEFLEARLVELEEEFEKLEIPRS